MSSLALPVALRRRRPHAGRLLALVEAHGSDVLLAVGVMSCALVLLATIASAFDVDSWLELVAGRYLVAHGLPHHETLTLLAAGRPWIDQQWLAQLLAYAIDRLGGLGLLGLVNVAAMMAAVAIAVSGARRMGGRPAVVLALLGLTAFVIVPSREVRTQAFAMPLFALLAYLLCRDSRRPDRRVYLCLPILVLWANLHGSAALGAGLVGLRGATLAWERWHAGGGSREGWRAWRRPLTLMFGAPLCLLLTPYGLSSLSYYRETMLGQTLRSVSEWQPVTSSTGMAIVFFTLAAIALWSFGRAPGRTTSWERIAVLALAAAGIDSIRNVLFFGLLALLVVPVSLGELQPMSGHSERSRPRVNAVLLSVVSLALVGAAAAVLTRPASALELSYQRPGVLRAVQTATAHDPALRVFAQDRVADWLLWRDPALAGRIAFDARFELLRPAQMTAVDDLSVVLGLDWKRAARGYRLIVLDRHEAAGAVRAFETEPGSRVLYDDGVRAVILRSAREAA